MPYCSAYKCDSKPINKSAGIGFHRFPRDEELKFSWIKAIGRRGWFPSVSSVLCSCHFEEKFIDRTSDIMIRLKESAVPTIFAVLPPPNQKSRKRKSKRDSGVTNKAAKQTENISQPGVKHETKYLIDHDYSEREVEDNPLQVSNSTCKVTKKSKEEISKVSNLPSPIASKTKVGRNFFKKYKNILIGVTGGLAAKQMPLLVRDLLCHTQHGSSEVFMKVIATRNALRFFDQTTVPENVEVLSDSDEWDIWKEPGDPVLHLEIVKWADLFLVAPLDANALAKISHGICDNLVTSVARAWSSEKPLIFCPSMYASTWKHPITIEQISKLKSWGYFEIPCVTIGSHVGEMANLDIILQVIRNMMNATKIIRIND